MPCRRVTVSRLKRWLRDEIELADLLRLSRHDRLELAWQAHRRLEAGAFDEAERIFRLLQQLAPTSDVTGTLGLAVCFQARGELTEAVRAYDAVLAIDPENVYALANRAEIRLLSRDIEAARVDLGNAQLVLHRNMRCPADLRDRVERLRAMAAGGTVESNAPARRLDS